MQEIQDGKHFSDVDVVVIWNLLFYFMVITLLESSTRYLVKCNVYACIYSLSYCFYHNTKVTLPKVDVGN